MPYCTQFQIHFIQNDCNGLLSGDIEVMSMKPELCRHTNVVLFLGTVRRGLHAKLILPLTLPPFPLDRHLLLTSILPFTGNLSFPYLSVLYICVLMAS